MHDAEAVDERGHGDQRAAGQQRRLEAPPAPDQEGGEGDGEDDPDRLHSIAPHGATAIGRGSRSDRRAAAPRAPRRSAKRPITVGPDPHTSAWWAPTSRAVGERLVDLGAQRPRGGLEVVGDQLVGQVGGRGGDLAQPGGEVGRVALQALAIELAVDVGGRELEVRGDHEHAVGRRRRQRGQALARARGEVAARAHLGGDVGAQPGADLAQERVVLDTRRAGHEPQGGAGIGAAAGHPGRDRDPLLDPDAHGSAVPPGPLAKALAAPGRRGSRPPPRGRSRDPSPSPGRRARARPRRPGRSAGRCSRARGARPRGSGRRRDRGSPWPAPTRAGRLTPRASASARNSLGARGARRARRRDGRAAAGPRGRGRGRRGPAPGSARASARAPCGGGRTRRARGRAPRGVGAGPVRSRTTRTESTLGTGWKTVRAIERWTRTSHASWASTLGTP